MKPNINKKYNWISERLEVTIKNVREKFMNEILHSDGSISAAKTCYSVEVEFIDKKGETVRFWTSWASRDFCEL